MKKSDSLLCYWWFKIIYRFNGLYYFLLFISFIIFILLFLTNISLISNLLILVILLTVSHITQHFLSQYLEKKIDYYYCVEDKKVLSAISNLGFLLFGKGFLRIYVGLTKLWRD